MVSREKFDALREAFIRSLPLRLRARNFPRKKAVESLISKYVLSTVFAAPIRVATGLVPITRVDERDVYVVAFPRSGITWFQNILAGVVYGIDPEYAPDSLIQSLVPDVLAKDFYRRYTTPMFFKSHYLPRPDYKRVVYLLRDGRDVMVSLYHFKKAETGKAPDFLWLVRFRQGLSMKWHEHVEAWLSNPYGADMIVIRYEDLKSDPLEQLRRFCAFVGIDRPDSFLRDVILKASFEKMREKEVKYGMDIVHLHPGNFFARRGDVGSYLDEMPKDVLEVFLREAGETLRKCGYL